MTKPFWVVTACVGVSLVLSVHPLWQRYRVEEKNKAVQLLVELPEVRALAAASGQRLHKVLLTLRSAGVGGIVVYEDTLPDLLDSGRIVALPPIGNAEVFATDSPLFERLSDCLSGKFGWPSVTKSDAATVLVDSRTGKRAFFPFHFRDLGTAGLGVDTSALAELRQTGIDLFARVGNYLGADPRGIHWTYSNARVAGCKGVIFVGTEVLGAREMIPESAELLTESGLWYAYIEFGKQAGDARMLAELVTEETEQPSVLRLHSVLPAELVAMTPQQAVERFVRAARERNCRLLYIRLLTQAGIDPVEANANYIRAIVEGLRRVGMDAKTAGPQSAPQRSPLIPVVAVSSPILSAAALLAVWRRPLWWSVAAVVPGLVADAASFGPPHAGHALIAALLFPTALTLAAAETAGRVSKVAAVALFFFTGILCVGAALAIAGMLSTLPYMLKASGFMGVKLAHVFPVIVVGGVLTFQAYRGRLFEHYIGWWHLGLVLLGAALLVLLVLRTGHETASVSGTEMGIRSAMDRFLPVRPRTKELLFGHPLLMAAMLATASGRVRFAPLLFACGAVGMASIVNTFCHIHTPLSVSMLRAVLGLAAGGILGLVGYAVLVPLGLRIAQVWNASWSSRGTSDAAT